MSPSILELPSLGVFKTKPTIDWKWFLAKPIFNVGTGAFEKFELLGALDAAANKSISISLNGVESASFEINILEELALQINPISTCVVCYRNGELVWSGMIWTINETVGDKIGTVTVTCVGWFQLLMMRLLKTGALKFGEETPLKGVGPEATSTATAHTYTEKEPQLIVKDLVERTNYEYPTGITLGTFEPNPAAVKWNVTYQKLQNIGQAIQQLANTEGGFDFRVDPETLKLNVYYKPVKSGTTVFGKGQDRPNTTFGFKWGPNNLATLTRTIDGSLLTNQMTTVGQFGVQGISTSLPSVKTYGLFETQQALSTVVSNTILAAFAAVEVLTREKPLPIYSFAPMAVNARINVPEPFVDYEIGDFVYLGARYGRMNVFSTDGKKAQAVRVFNMKIALDDNGNESVTEIQTTYQGTGA